MDCNKIKSYKERRAKRLRDKKISEYKKRRNGRLEARRIDTKSFFNDAVDKDVEWITVKGTHIPLINGEMTGKVGRKIERESESEYRNRGGSLPSASTLNDKVKDLYKLENYVDRLRGFRECIRSIPAGSEFIMKGTLY